MGRLTDELYTVAEDGTNMVDEDGKWIQGTGHELSKGAQLEDMTSEQQTAYIFSEVRPIIDVVLPSLKVLYLADMSSCRKDNPNNGHIQCRFKHLTEREALYTLDQNIPGVIDDKWTRALVLMAPALPISLVPFMNREHLNPQPAMGYSGVGRAGR